MTEILGVDPAYAISFELFDFENLTGPNSSAQQVLWMNVSS